MTGTRRDAVDPELRARQAARLPAQARANGWVGTPDPDAGHLSHPDPDVRALIERHRREAAVETAERIAQAIEALRPDAALASPLSYRAGRNAAARIAREEADR